MYLYEHQDKAKLFVLQPTHNHVYFNRFKILLLFISQNKSEKESV
jgi:hypothetical protein